MQEAKALSEADKLLIHGVTDFWYGAEQQPGWDRNSKAKQWTKKWFAGGEETDKLIQFKFKKVIEAVAEKKFEHWKSDRQGRLAIIILCDQYSRNCYRGSGKAFSFDNIALSVSKHILNSPDMYSDYKFFEKNFILMPLMHSEDKADSQTCVKQFTKLMEEAKDVNSQTAKVFEFTLKFANDHKAVIDKFGRYPTRNKALERQNTEAESQYLKSASGWGQ